MGCACGNAALGPRRAPQCCLFKQNAAEDENCNDGDNQHRRGQPGPTFKADALSSAHHGRGRKEKKTEKRDGRTALTLARIFRQHPTLGCLSRSLPPVMAVTGGVEKLSL